MTILAKSRCSKSHRFCIGILQFLEPLGNVGFKLRTGWDIGIASFQHLSQYQYAAETSIPQGHEVTKLIVSGFIPFISFE